MNVTIKEVIWQPNEEHSQIVQITDVPRCVLNLKFLTQMLQEILTKVTQREQMNKKKRIPGILFKLLMYMSTVDRCTSMYISKFLPLKFQECFT